MGRKRKPGTEWMPQRVYQGKSAYEYRPTSGECIRLAPLGASKAAVIRRYDDEVKKREILIGSFGNLVDEFFSSPAFVKLAKRTQQDYRRYSEAVVPVFGRIASNRIKPQHIRQYMDKRGTATEVQANREHSFMSKVFSWSYERGKVDLNPCLKVKKFTEQSRDRYITDEEYFAVLAEAPPMLQAAMEISYCCAARQGDVIALERSQLLDEGIFIKQGKTNKAQIKQWTDRLRAAVKLALTCHSVSSKRYVLANEKGQQITGTVLRSAYRKAKTRAAKKHPELSFDFTFHDIKARSISDWDGDKQKFSGHKTAAQVAIYDRKVPVVGTHE